MTEGSNQGLLYQQELEVIDRARNEIAEACRLRNPNRDKIRERMNDVYTAGFNIYLKNSMMARDIEDLLEDHPETPEESRRLLTDLISTFRKRSEDIARDLEKFREGTYDLMIGEV